MSTPFGMQPVPQPPAGSSTTRSPRAGNFRRGLGYALAYVCVMWLVHGVNMLLFGGNLAYFGVHPLDTSALLHIYSSPFIHGSFAHLSANTVPGAIFCFLIGATGHRAFWEVTAIAATIGGLGTWFFGGVGTTHIGASGLVYGWLAYLVVRGIFNRHFGQVLLGVVLAFVYGGLIWGVLPTQAGVSWQAHLFGAIGGLIAGAFITSDDPRPKTKSPQTTRRTGYGSY